MAMASKPFGRLLGIKEAASRLGISPHSLRRYILQGRIESIVIGRRRLVSETALERLVAASTVPVTCPPELRLDR